MHDDELSPSTQAEIAATRFEAEEQDRWLRLHSFIYRHEGAAMALSMTLMFGGIIAMFVASGYYEMSHGVGAKILWVCIGACWSGLILLLFTFARPNAASWWRATTRVLVVLTICAMIIVPMSMAFEWAIRQLA
ncbi:hypothetical protein IT414_00510 [bacterium]|nr:hypothetical protein [bacterium]